MAFACVFKRIAKRALCKTIVGNTPWEILSHSYHRAQLPSPERRSHTRLHPRSTNPSLKPHLGRGYTFHTPILDAPEGESPDKSQALTEGLAVWVVFFQGGKREDSSHV